MQITPPDSALDHRPHLPSIRARYHHRCLLFRPAPNHAPRGNTYTLLFNDRFIRLADIYSALSAEYRRTVPPTWWSTRTSVRRAVWSASPPTTTCDSARRFFCLHTSHTLDAQTRLKSAYHPNGNNGVECVNHILPPMLAMVVNERQDGWDAHLRHTESAYNSTVSTATCSAPIEVYINRLLRLPPSGCFRAPTRSSSPEPRLDRNKL